MTGRRPIDVDRGQYMGPMKAGRGRVWWHHQGGAGWGGSRLCCMSPSPGSLFPVPHSSFPSLVHRSSYRSLSSFLGVASGLSSSGSGDEGGSHGEARLLNNISDLGLRLKVMNRHPLHTVGLLD
jgi:hypothetical protein